MAKRTPARPRPPQTRTLSVRERIVRAASELLVKGGVDAVSTRAVSAAAGVQAPAIYRQFADMRALHDEAAREVLTAYVRQKSKREPMSDPVEELRRGWDEHIAFGLANPAAYALLYGSATPTDVPAAREGLAILEAIVTRVAESGRLKVSVANAASLMHAGAIGVTFAMLNTEEADKAEKEKEKADKAKEESRDLRLSRSMREAILSAITSSSAPPKAARGDSKVAARAIALRAVLAEGADTLSPGELRLLREWLDRLSSSGGG